MMGRTKKEFKKEKLKEFQKTLEDYNKMEKFEYVYIDNERTNFMISNKGRIFSLNYNKTGKIKELKTYLNEDGHASIVLKFKGKDYCRRIHRLVAIAFIPNLENKPEVHHKDGNHLNNDYTNLMWVTEEEHKKLTSELNQYDIRYGEDNPVCIYPDVLIEEVCKLLEKNKLSIKEISEKTGVPYHLINAIRTQNIRKKTSSKYNIDNFDNFKNHKYTVDQIKSVCRLLEYNKDYKYIHNETKVSIPVIKSIKLKKRWNTISSEFNF